MHGDPSVYYLLIDPTKHIYSKADTPIDRKNDTATLQNFIMDKAYI